MKPKRHPYSGFKNSRKLASVDKLGLVAFPNIAIRKELLKRIYTVVRNHDGATIIHFRIPKAFGYECQRARIDLSYEDVIRILNDELKE
ncbi:hypothetical protein O3632_03910 [Streptococcus parasanguinis]|uniref:hypothetical protein n=1 Tax=Streptococcus parasanguinis TaxID=1318 RepID=UPI00352DF524